MLPEQSIEFRYDTQLLIDGYEDLDEDEVFEIAEPAASGLAFSASDQSGQELELEDAALAYGEGIAPGEAASFDDEVALGETADLSGLDEAVGVYGVDDDEEDWLALSEQGEEAFSAEGSSAGDDDATVALNPVELGMNDDVTVALDPAELGIADESELPKTDEFAALEADEPEVDEVRADAVGPEADGVGADPFEASQPEPEQPESDEPEPDQAEPNQPEVDEPEQDASEQLEPEQLELEGAAQDEQEPGEPEPVDESALTRILFIETDIEDLAPEQGGQDD